MYGYMLLVFLILAIVTVCVTIVGTYFLLNAENYHWQWTSFCAAASTALCVCALPHCTCVTMGWSPSPHAAMLLLTLWITDASLQRGAYDASAAPCGRYVFLYAVHYFFVKTKMTGLFQTCFYFGYTLMFCLGLAIMTGALGYLGSAVFVRRIYRNIKCD